MSLKSCTVADTNRRKLEIEVDAAAFDAACDTAYRKAAAKISVPGFRKGKAPRHVIEKMYGTEFYIEDAVNAVYPDALEAAIKESEIEYVDDKIDLDVVSLGKGEGLVFTAVVTVKPEVKLTGDYKGLKAEQRTFEITDEAVEAEFEKARERDARVVDVDDRPAQNGDTACFDFTGYVDGVPFDGGAAENYTLELGSGQFIPGFEEQMVGHNVGEEFDVNVTFPEEYHAEDLKGKPAVFKVKVNSIQYKELPDLDDEFAKDVSEFNTLDELKADIRTKLEEQAEKTAKQERENAVVDKLVEETEIDVPACMVDNRIEGIIRENNMRMAQQGISFEQYLSYMGSTVDQFKEMMRPNAERQVKANLILEAIVKKEAFEVSDELFDEKIKEMADMYHMEADKLKESIIGQDTENIKEDMKMEMAVAFLVENAKWSKPRAKAASKTAKSADEKEAPAKSSKSTTAKTAGTKTTKTAAKSTTKKTETKKAEKKEKSEE